ncbi:acetyl-CoA C-acetyltransferase [Stackebrandtia nassauensis]|uniref:Probable acetyl-CoA acetyltransferase n=1 Tax=Stackebrandtia nassauensis (strain DSM 44728 / CIP 108903 / NRRL B-16338 / NBRC 102104 / LLR-40K-21) TaxID=446470 RepID=D3Q096_STANL|nr:acetyl-CoA C-acetyltransferase [Stackebrandtia nassauensis]ADD45625.1 acetyl-CoA acetyltransferase [Stackebrandtia nassauensis DSM 44728]
MTGDDRTTSVLVAGARTPNGKLLGGLGDIPATKLGSHAIAAALTRAGVDAGQVEYVILGQVLQAGAGQNPARQAAAGAGIPLTIPSLNVNKVCLSGLTAIAMADQLIRAGEIEIAVAGGMESMTLAPHLLTGQRKGYKYGDVTMADHMALDGLTDAYEHIPMGESTENHNTKLGIGRAEQDEFAAASHVRAAAAQKNGRFDREIAAFEVPQRKGDPIVVSADEGVRADTTPEVLARLRPSFTKDGTITAGNSSPISDGAAAVVVMSKAKANELGLEYLAEIGAHGMVAGPDTSLHSQPSRAIQAALAKSGKSTSDLSVIEINEAFAAVGIQSTRDLGVDPQIVNPNGGAIALGHPIGASGARLALTLAHELRERGGGLGAAALCGGGGQGDALLLRVS